MWRLLFCFFPLLSNAQITFQKTYDALGTTMFSIPFSSSAIKDGGVIMGGSCNIGGARSDFYALKVDSIGAVQWSKSYTNTGVNQCNSIVQTIDSGYIMGGEVTLDPSNIINRYFFVLKTDSDGAVSWAKTYGGTNRGVCLAITQTQDGGFAMLGQVNTNYGDIYLVKTDNLGNIKWTKTYNDTLTDTGSVIIETQDKGFIIAGKNNSPTATGYFAFVLMKTDSSGNIAWSNTYYNSIAVEDVLNSAIITSDGGFLMTGSGYIINDGFYVLAIKTDEFGNIEWSKRFMKSVKSPLYGNTVIEGLNQTFWLTTSYRVDTTETNTDTDILLTQLDSGGNFIKAKIIGEKNIFDEALSAFSKNGSVMIAGCKGNNDLAFYLINSDSTGNSGCNTRDTMINVFSENINFREKIFSTSSLDTVTALNVTAMDIGVATDTLCFTNSLLNIQNIDKQLISIYPNPSSGHIKCSSSEIINNIKITTVTGKIIYNQNTDQKSISINLTNYPSGVYLIVVSTEKNIKFGKLYLQ